MNQGICAGVGAPAAWRMATAAGLKRVAGNGGGFASRFAPFLALALLLAGVAPATAASLEGIRMHQAPDHIRVVFDTSAAVEYKVFTLEKPLRVVVDLKQTRPGRGFEAPAIKGEAIKRIRRARRQGGTYRVVLDLAAKVRPKDFTLKPIPPYGHRLVLDLFAEDRPAPQPRRRPPPDGRDVMIALDPGHGGEDPGAIAATGAYEKNIVLAIAKRVQRNLNAVEGFSAVLVRDGDYYVPLRGRTDIAANHHADLFVSIHADAFHSPRVRGASVYTLSQRGASSEEAKWLAERENKSDLLGGVDLSHYDGQLPKVLLDISMNLKEEASLHAGDAVMSSLASVTRMHKKRVEQAGFVVLKRPDMPAILVETGFLSNPEEARLLATASHQNKVAAAIANGIRSHLISNAPGGTAIAADDYAMRYVIERGDTLSEIAARHRVSASLLRTMNGLRSDRIRVGQELIIPTR